MSLTLLKIERSIKQSIDKGYLTKQYEYLHTHEVVEALLDVIATYDDVVGEYVEQLGKVYIKNQEKEQ